LTTPPDGPRGASDLLSRIDAGIRERIEEAVDDACLTALVRARAAAGQPAPIADNPDDRAEFQSLVRDFLVRLGEDIPAGAAGDGLDPRADARAGANRGAGDDTAALVSAQVALAKEIPDYWQRFDAIRAAYVEERSASGRERPGLLRRLLRG
jgi:hypothetical protein